MKLKKDATDQKLRGAYYTPLKLAEQIVKIFKDDNSLRSVFEPSCGDGVFFDALINQKQLSNYNKLLGLELNEKEILPMKKKYQDTNIVIEHKDFFDFYRDNNLDTKFDLVLGNPPYIRYQYLSESQREEMSDILVSHGMKSNKLINAWVTFTVACVHLLSENGKIAFVIPAEVLQVAYAKDLRRYLTSNLEAITLITFNELVFDDIEQEIVVLIGERKSENKGIRILELNNLDSFSADIFNIPFQKISSTEEKWTKYFTSDKETEFVAEIKKNKNFTKFSDIATINVGITTGNNAYFSLDEKTVKNYDLMTFCKPLIGRSVQANSVFFEKNDWLENVKNKKKAFLLDLNGYTKTDLSDKQQAYIELGEKEEQNDGYKCKIREYWYQIPSIWVPDAFFLRRNNLYPKLVLNKCDAVSTDTMHRIAINEGIDKERVILSYYNSISFAFTEICGRSYGGGVLEILPGEVGDIYLPNLENVSDEKVHSLLLAVDKIVRENQPIENALSLVDKEILIGELKMKKADCGIARNIWRKLQTRRLNRGK